MTFPHAMLREIYEQPEAIERTIALYLDQDRLKGEIAARLAPWPGPAGEILIAASGTSRHSGLYGEILLEDTCGLAVDVEYASEYSCRGGTDLRHPGLLVLSQSGETSDTLAALNEGRRQNFPTLAITNSSRSTMATEADISLQLAAGPEEAIPATKSFTCQLTMLYLLSLYTARAMCSLDGRRLAQCVAALRAVPASIASALEPWREQAATLARKYKDGASFLYLGRGIHYAIAREGALKLKESSYIHAEAYPAGELKHGPNALVSERVPLVVLATVDRAAEWSVLRYQKTIQLLRELQQQGAHVIAIVNVGDMDVAKVDCDRIEVPLLNEYLLPILEVVPLQLFAYFMALENGVDMDHPRHLSKSVVEPTASQGHG